MARFELVVKIIDPLGPLTLALDIVCSSVSTNILFQTPSSCTEMLLPFTLAVVGLNRSTIVLHLLTCGGIHNQF